MTAADTDGRWEDGEQMAAVIIIGLVVLLGLLGFINSFARVADAVRPYFGDLAPSVPLGVDIGIFAFTGLDLLMAKMNLRTRWLRLVPWSLVAATVYLNVAAENEWIGRVAHAVLPLLWVVAVEAGAHVVRVKAGLAGRGVERMDRVRFSRWILSPVSTALLWRRMILWEIRSYPQALERERDRVLALCALKDRYGWRWRWKAPRQQRALQRLGELTPVGVVAEIEAQAPSSVNDSPVSLQVPAVPATDVEGPEATPRASGPVDVDDLLPVAREIRHDLGRVPGWKVMAAEVRKRGLPCGTPKAQALVAALKAEPNGDGQ